MIGYLEIRGILKGNSQAYSECPSEYIILCYAHFCDTADLISQSYVPSLRRNAFHSQELVDRHTCSLIGGCGVAAALEKQVPTPRTSEVLLD